MDDETEAGQPTTAGETATSVRGPYGWINWYAERIGQPRRESKHPDAVVIRPIWEEFALYTDAPINGPWLQLGPYELLTLDPVAESRLGLARKALLLRAWDHLSDEPTSQAPLVTDVEDYFGGDIGDELAALLGLALARRIRSGGPVRKGLPGIAQPLGLPSEMEHHPPALEPPRRAPMIPWLGQPVALSDAEGLLCNYPELAAPDALVRAARQYVDGLWFADLDPRMAWIKLIGSLEVAANRFDDTREESNLAQLKRHRPKLYKALEKAPPEVAEVVAAETAHFLNAERKLHSFIKRFDPGPPRRRPAGAAQFDWARLDSALTVIYEHARATSTTGSRFRGSSPSRRTPSRVVSLTSASPRSPSPAGADSGPATTSPCICTCSHTSPAVRCGNGGHRLARPRHGAKAEQQRRGDGDGRQTRRSSPAGSAASAPTERHAVWRRFRRPAGAR